MSPKLSSIEDGRLAPDKVRSADDAWNAGQAGMTGEWDDPEQDIYND